MAPRNPSNSAAAVKPKKKRNRKARTEVSSSSSESDELSSSSEEEGTDVSLPRSTAKISNKSAEPTKANVPAAAASESASASPAAQDQHPSTKQSDFQAWYLKQATREFADDLEELRTGSDWKGQRSVDVLVRALGQGAGGVFGGKEGKGE